MNIGVSVNEVLVRPAITDFRKSHLRDKVATFYPVRNNKNNSRQGAKTQRKDYYVCVFLCALARIIFIFSGA
jgi:hypothetical protein